MRKGAKRKKPMNPNAMAAYAMAAAVGGQIPLIQKVQVAPQLEFSLEDLEKLTQFGDDRESLKAKKKLVRELKEKYRQVSTEIPGDEIEKNLQLDLIPESVDTTPQPLAD